MSPGRMCQHRQQRHLPKVLQVNWSPEASSRTVSLTMKSSTRVLVSPCQDTQPKWRKQLIVLRPTAKLLRLQG